MAALIFVATRIIMKIVERKTSEGLFVALLF